ncbi:hypothetical protein WME73_25100 [Sorangium sp. So ce302]|uniref:magnesium transporter MgtE N-terminal domain-containing protein n=1 Tax=Sorangium sp. So ce302 TaxID=3133297 RepID=UPI003F60DFEC
MSDDRLTAAELGEIWAVLSPEERADGVEHLERGEAHSFFLGLAEQEQAAVLLAMKAGERRLWMRLLAPDDAADVIQLVPQELRASLLEMLDEPTRREVAALMAGAGCDRWADRAGGAPSGADALSERGRCGAR